MRRDDRLCRRPLTFLYEPAGFVPATARGEATLVVREVQDASLTISWKTVQGLPLVNPLQTIWDLCDLGGADRRESADRLPSTIAALRA